MSNQSESEIGLPLSQHIPACRPEALMRLRMLDDLSTRVDSTDNKLRKASRKLNDFIRRNEGMFRCSMIITSYRFKAHFPETKSGWCICILIFVLIALLIAVIIT